MRILWSIVLLVCVGCGGNVPESNNVSLCDSPHWVPLAAGLIGDPLVASLIEYKGELYAVGRFSHSGELPLNNIAKWNGMRWDSVGGGLANYSNNMCVYHDDLYVTGTFDFGGGIKAIGIARWNGTCWDSLVGSITNGYGNAMAVYKDKLYVGGSLRSVNYEYADALAIWNGKSWSFMKDPLIGPLDYPPQGGSEKVHYEPYVSAMSVYKGSLFIAGHITGAGSVLANDLIRWNDTCWSAPGTGLGYREWKTGVHVMTVYKGNLYIGGAFDSVDGVQANNIAMFDGKNWHPLAEGINNGEVNAMVVNDGKLFVAGNFSVAGTLHLNGHMATWDGNTWTAASDSTYITNFWSGNIATLAVYNNAVYAGGQFDLAGGQIVNNVARWGCEDRDTSLTAHKTKQK